MNASHTFVGSLSWRACFDKLSSFSPAMRQAIRRHCAALVRGRASSTDINHEIFGLFRRHGGDFSAVILELAADPRPIVNVCAWCPDKAARDAEVEAAGAVPSHILCPACEKKFFPELLEVLT